MIKKILVPGLNAVCDPRALQLSLQVARLFDGHVEYLHVHPGAAELARYTASLDVESAMFSEQIWTAMAEGDKKTAARSRQVFDAFCAREVLSGPASAVTASWREVEGDAVEQVTAETLYSDVAVFGRPMPPGDLTATGLADVLVGCGRPLLLAPSSPCDNPLSTVVIGWKDTAASAHAVAAAMPILAKAQKIHILCVGEGPDGERHALASGERLAAYLRAHGLKPQAGHVRAGDRDPCEVLLEAADEKLKAGLLVMGGYGHSRVREFIFGGFTRRVLHSAPLPVLLCH